DACDDNDECTIDDTCTAGACVGSPRDCDDGIACTIDSCDPASGCINENSDTDCDDNNACTINDTCTTGTCIGEPIDCDDQNPCTTDSCDPQQGCLNIDNDDACDDNDECTIDDTCTAGTCVGSPRNCDDSNECTNDFCDSQSGCVHEDTTGLCDDGNPCTDDDRCINGECRGFGPDCDDDNICTTDVCDLVDGCSNTPNNDPCDDGNLCTTNDTCTDGACQPGTPVNCNDNNPCTTDSCDPAIGCVNVFNTIACDDENACTENDACTDGTCVGEPVACNDNNVCTDDVCDTLLGCIFTDNADACDDQNACTIGDVCDGGICQSGTAADCDDNNPCTTDSCDPAIGCVNESNTIACDDENACTENDTCTNGTCVGEPVDCDDENMCTDDSCDPALGCQYSNNSMSCDDRNECTMNDVCSDGACQPGAPVVCNDDNSCTDDSCDTKRGCVFEDNTLPCDDGLYCNGGESCMNGACQPGLAACPDTICDEVNDRCVECLGDDDCRDANNCTIDTCSDDGVCIHETIPDCNPCPRRVSTMQKGSLLVFPDIRIRWNNANAVVEDTIIHVTNDFNEDVRVHYIFVNGDDPLPPVICCDPPTIEERAHPGWNRLNWTSTWTGNESNYFSLATGLPKGAPPFAGLDNGPEGPGRPDPNSDGRIMRGFLLAWAVDNTGHQVSWNHLQGGATRVAYDHTSAWEYPAYAFQTCAPETGMRVGDQLGTLNLNGDEYQMGYGRLLLDFFASGSTPFSGMQQYVTIETDVALVPVAQDFRLESVGPIETRARFDIWNQNEDYLSHTSRCISCWDGFLLGQVDLPNNFLVRNLQTNKGKARIDGLSGSSCDSPGCCQRDDTTCQMEWAQTYGTRAEICTENVPLVGTAVKELTFQGASTTIGHAGVSLVGQGIEAATIHADLESAPQPASAGRDGRRP
ncbi:MAG: hypothetical protein ACPGXK_13335, partial [Phycisphaerae bacterium]